MTTKMRTLPEIGPFDWWPKVARGHGSRTAKTICVAESCRNRLTKDHWQNREKVREEWEKGVVRAMELTG